MRRKRLSVEQIVAVLKQVEVGVPVAEVCQQAGITEQTSYRWKKQYVGLEIDQIRQLKQLQEENATLKRLVAELNLDKTMLQDVHEKSVSPSRREVVSYLRGVCRVNQRRACRLARIPVSTFRWQSTREPKTALRLRIREIAQTRIRYGYRENRVLLKREGWKVGKNLVYRLYRERALGGALQTATQALRGDESERAMQAHDAEPSLDLGLRHRSVSGWPKVSCVDGGARIHAGKFCD